MNKQTWKQIIQIIITILTAISSAVLVQGCMACALGTPPPPAIGLPSGRVFVCFHPSYLLHLKYVHF